MREGTSETPGCRTCHGEAPRGFHVHRVTEERNYGDEIRRHRGVRALGAMDINAAERPERKDDSVLPDVPDLPSSKPICECCADGAPPRPKGRGFRPGEMMKSERIDTSALTPEQREDWEERAAIMEYDGAMSREDAERLALEDVLGIAEKARDGA